MALISIDQRIPFRALDKTTLIRRNNNNNLQKGLCLAAKPLKRLQ